MQVVHTALRVDLWFVGARCICELRALYDVEIIVCSVAAGVPFGANRSALMVSADIELVSEE
jgi:hypothetical protein